MPTACCPFLQLALDDSVEADWKRTTLYPGPDILSLPEVRQCGRTSTRVDCADVNVRCSFRAMMPLLLQDIQEMFSDYLAERGIDDDLANFIPAYIDLKENKEYLRWLGNLQQFFAAK